MSEMSSSPITYKAAGVDTQAKGQFTDSLGPLMRATHGPRVLNMPGHFAGLFRLDSHARFRRNWKRPLLVAGADGVGTKLMVAAAVRDFSGIGIDLVAMSVNDVLVMGAEPLFFLDYLAVSKLDSEALTEIVASVAEGCRQAGCALLGGETAEMPGLYRPGELDMAGFAVGVVEKNRLITGRAVAAGDAIIGLASSGLHSNGFSLARKLIFEMAGRPPNEFLPELGCTAAAELLKPTRIYARPVGRLLRKWQRKRHGRPIHGMAHVTGESFVGNLPRSFGAGLQAIIDSGSWPRPPIFDLLANWGKLPPAEMFATFNMGIGFVLFTAPDFVVTALDHFSAEGLPAYKIGEIQTRLDPDSAEVVIH